MTSYRLYVTGNPNEVTNLSCKRATELRRYFRELGFDAHIEPETNNV